MQEAVPIRGINYDTGVNYQPGSLSRRVWDTDSVKRDMEIIATDLHCNAVLIFGTDTQRMQECAEYALEEGLNVWMQPRFIDGSQEQVLDHLAQMAKTAETLRQRYGNVILNIGCEHSLFMKGILPGKTYQTRIFSLMIFWLVMGWFSKKLNRHLQKACNAARTHFNGPLTYSAGAWETVDWTPFDFVGVNHYRDSRNKSNYVEELRSFQNHGKPVAVTEFGCCTYQGAEKKGGSGFRIIDWKSKPPQVKEGYQRDEQTQAEYLQELIEIYRSENVVASFVYAFSEPSHPHTPNPEMDLDMASYGIVKVLRKANPPLDIMEQWEPKEAFYKLADLYRNDAFSG